jgi:hypothetical protein
METMEDSKASPTSLYYREAPIAKKARLHDDVDNGNAVGSTTAAGGGGNNNSVGDDGNVQAYTTDKMNSDGKSVDDDESDVDDVEVEEEQNHDNGDLDDEGGYDEDNEDDGGDEVEDPDDEGLGDNYEAEADNSDGDDDDHGSDDDDNDDDGDNEPDEDLLRRILAAAQSQGIPLEYLASQLGFAIDDGDDDDVEYPFDQPPTCLADVARFIVSDKCQRILVLAG